LSLQHHNGSVLIRGIVITPIKDIHGRAALMSALSPIADMCSALAHVRFVPTADITDAIDRPVLVASGYGRKRQEEIPMLKQIILICASLILAANSVNSQQSPPNSEKVRSTGQRSAIGADGFSTRPAPGHN
jgi:hypothetical protein